MDFLPLYDDKKYEFNIWEINKPIAEAVPEVNQQEEFLKECAQLREEARQQGYQEGMQQAALQIQQNQQQLQDWLTLLQQPVTLLDQILTQEIIHTIMWICETCIGIELTINPEKIASLMETIKKELPSLRGDKKLVMHPLDIDTLKGLLFEQQTGILTNIFVGDETLNRGDFYLKSEHTELDGRLKIRLQKLFSTYLHDKNEDTDLTIYHD